MTTRIEFIGPPGCGKSTLTSKIAQRDGYISTANSYVTDHRVTKEIYFTENTHPLYRTSYQVAPRPVQRTFHKFVLKPRLRRTAFFDFLEQNPQFLESVVEATAPADRKAHLTEWCIRGAERTHLGHVASRPNEVLCLDENLHHYGANILVEGYHDPVPSNIDNYFEAIPLPDILVYIDAPSDLCLSRQRERGSSVVVDSEHTPDTETIEDTQEKFREMCRTVAEYRADDCHIIHVSNTGTVEESVSAIFNQIDKYMKEREGM